MEQSVETFPRTLITGSSGFVGTAVVDALKKHRARLLTPTHQQLDITSKDAMKAYFDKYHPEVVINLAAFTNLPEAEKQRGDRAGPAWQLNMTAVGNLAQVCNTTNTFLIHISTDGIFPGTDSVPGPYPEDSKLVDNPDNLSWYGFTKLQGEYQLQKFGQNYAIVRISHPFGNTNSEKDFVKKVEKYIHSGYPLFTDQLFTPTYLDDLAKTINQITINKLQGIYHVACQGVITPYQLGLYLAGYLRMKEEVIPGSITDWAKKPGSIPRPKLGGLLAEQTQAILGLHFSSWDKAINKITGFR